VPRKVNQTRTQNTLTPYIEKLCVVKLLRDGVELAEYENIEHTAAHSGFRNTECISDGGRGIRKRMVPEQLGNMVFDGIMHFSDLLNFLQDFWLACATRLSPKDLSHHAIIEIWVSLRERVASDRDHIGGPSLQSVVRHSFIVAGVKQQIDLSKFNVLDFEFVALFPLNLNWEEVLISAPIFKLESL
jgi:hypothetical protein